MIKLCFGMMAGIAMLGSGAAAIAASPDLNGGTWQVVDPPQRLLTVDGKAPPLRAAARAIYDRNIAARTANDLSFDDTQKCLPPGFPRILGMPGTLGRFEFLQRPKQIVITYEWNRVWRTVGMTSRPEYIAPQYAGRSKGHWEGRTLVIDSTDFTTGTWLDNAGLPHSDALHLVERYTPERDGDTMKLRLHIDDRKIFTSAWDTVLTLRHDPQGRIQEDECVERKNLAWAHAANGP